MRVLHISYGSPMIALSKGLQQSGIQSTSCHFDGHPFHFQPDLCLQLNRYPPEKRQGLIRSFFQKCIQSYDIFHFHFGETFFPDKSDLAILKKSGKKMIVHHHGSDIRMLSMAQKDNHYVRVKPEWTEAKIKRNLSILSNYMTHAIVQDHELSRYVSSVYQHVHVIPHTIDLKQFHPKYPTIKAAPPLVVHAPTKRNLKGTASIIKAVNELRTSGLSFDFQLIEGMNHQKTMELLSAADIVIDQLQIGAYGFLSSEAMALGKPVICYIREDLKKKYPKELPIVHANPDTITSVLRRLINQPEKWKELGIMGRGYVAAYHDTQKVMDKYIDIYRQL